MAIDRIVLPPPSPAELEEFAESGAEGAGVTLPVSPSSPAPSHSPSLDAPPARRPFVSRAGYKLQAALLAFGIDVRGRVCADLGANVGGFTDCLLRAGAARVYAVDTAYGVLAWSLRKDARVVVRDRSNALHMSLPEPVTLVTVDVGWTRQERVLPAARKLLAAEGVANPLVLTLIKPHYESELARRQRGVLTEAQSEEALWSVIDRLGLPESGAAAPSWNIRGIMRSPLEGQKGNHEYVAWLEPVTPHSVGGTSIPPASPALQ